MSNPLFNPLVGDLQQVLSLRLQQHGLGASNLANANTPDYKARYIDFEDALADVFSDGKGGPGATEAEVLTRAPDPLSADGNSVNAEDEMTRLTANNLQFNATVEVLSRQLALIEYGATDGGR